MCVVPRWPCGRCFGTCVSSAALYSFSNNDLHNFNNCWNFLFLIMIFESEPTRTILSSSRVELWLSSVSASLYLFTEQKHNYLQTTSMLTRLLRYRSKHHGYSFRPRSAFRLITSVLTAFDVAMTLPLVFLPVGVVSDDVAALHQFVNSLYRKCQLACTLQPSQAPALPLDSSYFDIDLHHDLCPQGDYPRADTMLAIQDAGSSVPTPRSFELHTPNKFDIDKEYDCDFTFSSAAVPPLAMSQLSPAAPTISACASPPIGGFGSLVSAVRFRWHNFAQALHVRKTLCSSETNYHCAPPMVR